MATMLREPPVSVPKLPVPPTWAGEREDAEAIDVLSIIQPERLTWDRVDWVVLAWIAAVHAGCLAAPFFFTWQALGAAVLLHWLTASLGICLGYHRYLSHRSMKLKSPAEFFTMLCAVLSGEGSPLMWSAVHRLHHQRSDRVGDPHSPLDGKFWSHILWLFVRQTRQEREALFQRYTPDLLQRPVIGFFEQTYVWWLFGSAVAAYALGGWPLLLWGVCVRMTIAYHSTWFVNSATHLWGYRNYDTTDESRNLWWVALLAYGEGWHNNHHAHPSLAPAGHRWWEIDVTWWAIKFLRLIGQASHVRDRLPDRRDRTAELSDELAAA